MEMMTQGLSKWFYLGIAAIILGMFFIYKAKGVSKSKAMENGYFILLLGLVGVISEWTDFATVLFLLVIISGILIILDKMLWRNRSKHYIHYAYEFFPVMLGVFVLRAFLFEAYQIPSSSMRPDLTVGDFILVSKFDYGIREPITNRVVIPVGKISRGDVVVFKDPLVRNRDLIKRVVAIGGDKIEYRDKRLTINGTKLNYTESGMYTYNENIPSQGAVEISNQRYNENLLGVNHSIITWDKVPTLFSSQVQVFSDSQNCKYYGDDGFECTVPLGKYFMMGDNRDNSFDSRYWGFVDDNAILGRATKVIFNFSDSKRMWQNI